MSCFFPYGNDGIRFWSKKALTRKGCEFDSCKLKLGDERYIKLDIPPRIDLPKHGRCMPPCSDYNYITTGKLYMYLPWLSPWGIFSLVNLK